MDVNGINPQVVVTCGMTPSNIIVYFVTSWAEECPLPLLVLALFGFEAADLQEEPANLHLDMG